MKKMIMVVFSIFLILGLVGCGTTKQTTTVQVKPPDPISFSGNGSQFEKITLTKGVSVFNINHLNKDNLTVNLLASNGQTLGTLANQDGQWNISTPFSIPISGTYGILVNGNGNWKITINQPRPQTATLAHGIYSGTDTQVTPMFGLKTGLMGFRIKYTGTSFFNAYLMDNNGNIVATLIKKDVPHSAEEMASQPFDQAVPLQVTKDGIYFFCIQTVGNWSITVQ